MGAALEAVVCATQVVLAERDDSADADVTVAHRDCWRAQLAGIDRAWPAVFDRLPLH
jgi:hypothetical protein